MFHLATLLHNLSDGHVDPTGTVLCCRFDWIGFSFNWSVCQHIRGTLKPASAAFRFICCGKRRKQTSVRMCVIGRQQSTRNWNRISKHAKFGNLQSALGLLEHNKQCIGILFTSGNYNPWTFLIHSYVCICKYIFSVFIFWQSYFHIKDVLPKAMLHVFIC
jgi:hypothetical protein